VNIGKSANIRLTLLDPKAKFENTKGLNLMAAKTPHPLGLKPAEWRAITDCMWARSVNSNGHYLPSFNRMATHGRMVERGFMTEVPESEKGMSPPSPEWRIFKMTDDNIDAYNAAMAALNAQPVPADQKPA
jgi:hypothetical protein